MQTFAYQARDQAGKIVSGVQEAINEENAMNSLMSRGLLVLSIQQKSAGRARKRELSVKPTDLVLFTRQLSTMVEAGIPLVGSLTALFESTDARRQAGLRSVIGDITSRVEGGESFSEAIKKHPRVFSRLYTSMVQAGEQGGLLSEILDRLAAFLEAAARLSKKVKSAMTYPVVVICIAIAITAFLVIRVVPVFNDIFSEFGQDLPGPTKFLVAVSDFARAYWWSFVIFGVAGFLGLKAILRTKAGAQTWDRWKLKLPVFGPLIQKIAMTRFARTFAQLIRSGVPILEVLDIVGATSGNYVIEESIRSVSHDVERGDNLSVALAKQPIFPPMLLRMIAAGEATGQIDNMLEKMADFWDTEIEATLDALTSLLEPFLICFLGVVVGGIVIAMFLPIFRLNEVVSG